MADVSIRELRSHAGEVVARAQRGEHLTITMSGKPVASLVALQHPPVALDELRRRWARLPHVDPPALHRDVDVVIDPSV
jgi:prevent-host-death family protein